MTKSTQAIRFSRTVTTATISAAIAIFAFSAPAAANPLDLFGALDRAAQNQRLAYAPAPEIQDEDVGAEAGIAPRFQRQIVAYATVQKPGTIVIDTSNTYLYYVLGGGKAVRYGIGVGRDGFRWSGTQSITRKSEWPDWIPPQDMLRRQPYLPRFMAGGPGNPLGARAMYLGSTIYRIHGTNNPSTIGGRVSSGCIRMTNDDVMDLYARVNVGTKVIVLPDSRNAISNS